MSRRSVFLLAATAAVAIPVVWGGMFLAAQSSADTGGAMTTRTMSGGEVDIVDVSDWRESVDLTREQVASWEVDGHPLVTSAMRYDVDRRVIHPEESRREAFPVQLPEEQWRQRLTPTQFRIIRQSGTERPFTSHLDKVYEPGIYYSRATGQPLFSSEDKFDSGTGWPSFTKPITPDALAYFTEVSFFSRNIEVVDSLSGAHLGHVFTDGPAPTYQRYCINGEALIFVPEGEEPPKLLLPAE